MGNENLTVEEEPVVDSGGEAAEGDLASLKQQQDMELRSRRRRLYLPQSRIASVGLLVSGAAVFIVSYFKTSIILSLIGLGLTFWGVIFLLVVPGKLVKEDLVKAAGVSALRPLGQLLAQLGYAGAAIYMPPLSLEDVEAPKMFVPRAEGASRYPKSADDLKDGVRCTDPEGLLLASVGSELSRTFEKAMGRSFPRIDYDYFSAVLPDVLTDNFALFDDVTIERTEDGAVRVLMRGEPGERICEQARQYSGLHEQLGCPICSSVGIILAHAVSKPVILSQSTAGDGAIANEYRVLDGEAEREVVQRQKEEEEG